MEVFKEERIIINNLKCNTMDEEVKKRLEDAGLEESDLTAEELQRLKQQIIDEKNGTTVLDGVLSDSNIYYRRMKHEKN